MSGPAMETYMQRRQRQTAGRGDPLHVEREPDGSIVFCVYLYDRDGQHIATVRTESDKLARLVLLTIGASLGVDRPAK